MGSAFPKPCYAACAAYPRRAHAATERRSYHAKKIQHTPPQPRCENPAAIDVHHASPMMKTIAKLRDKYDLKMTAERYTPDNTMPKTDEKFIRK